jgi:hypothetical protein
MHLDYFGSLAPPDAAQNRREYVIEQPYPGRAEFFALPGL